MKTIKLISIIVLASLCLIGCKNIEDEIVGVWNFQTFDNKPQGTQTWTFKDDGLLIRITTSDSEIQFDSCNYVVTQSLVKKQLTVTGSKQLTGYPEINGVYRIDKFKEDILIMTRTKLSDDEAAGSYYRCEMIRKQ